MSKVIAAPVTVKSITHFTRENHHTRKTIVENFVCVTMLNPMGKCFVTYTRASSEFARSIVEGESFDLSGKFKEDRSYDGMRQTVVTHCKKNFAPAPKKENKRTAKVKALLGI